MRDSPLDMTAAGRSRSFVLRALMVALVLVVGGVWRSSPPAGAQTTTAPVATTVPAGTSATSVAEGTSAAPSATSVGPSPATAATAGDETSTRTVNRIVFILVAFAVVLVALALWFWRATRPLPRHLDGLDVMGTRRWREAGAGERSQLLAPIHERRAEPGADEDLEVGAEPVAGAEGVSDVDPVAGSLPGGAEAVAEPVAGGAEAVAEPIAVGAEAVAEPVVVGAATESSPVGADGHGDGAQADAQTDAAEETPRAS